MKPIRSFILLMLAAAVSPATLAQTVLTLEDAQIAARQPSAASINPTAVLEIDRILPNRCVPPAAEASIHNHAQRRARQHHALSVTRHFLSALQKEDALLAARESVASTHAAWKKQAGASTPTISDVAASAATARAFADYQHALAHRELTLADLREALLKLADLIGLADAPPSQLAHPAFDAYVVPPPAAPSPAHPQLAAVGALKRWWQQAAHTEGGHRAACLEALEHGSLRISADLMMQLDTLSNRFNALKARSLPAAEAELSAAEALLDHARSAGDAAPSMYHAMTGTLLAQAGVREVQYEIMLLAMRLDHLR